MEPLGLTGGWIRGDAASSPPGGRTAEVGVWATLPDEAEALRHRPPDRTRERRPAAETNRPIPVDRGELAGTRRAAAVTGHGRRYARTGLTEFPRSETEESTRSFLDERRDETGAGKTRSVAGRPAFRSASVPGLLRPRRRVRRRAERLATDPVTLVAGSAA